MKLGDWRHRITIQKSVIHADVMGNQIAEWTDYYTCWSYVNHLSGSEYWEAAQVNEEEKVFFLVRYCEKLKEMDTLQFRVIFQNEIYNLSSVDNVQYKNQTIKLMAKKAER